jgi:hypothetical protein
LRGAATLGGEASSGLRRAVSNSADFAETFDQQHSFYAVLCVWRERFGISTITDRANLG